jgi:hypothetical protein
MTSFYLPPVRGIEEARGGRRRSIREIKRGVSMVVPVEPITISRGEVIGPPRGGKSERLSVDHRVVVERPELFRPVLPNEDVATTNVMVRRLLRRKREGALREVPAWVETLELDEPRPAGSGRGRWRLP